MQKVIIICFLILLNFHSAKACNYTASFSGPTMVCSGNSFNYLTKPVSGHYYRWVANGGSIVYGQGQDSIWVIWPEPFSCSLQLFDSTATCVSSVSQTIQVSLSSAYLSKEEYYQVNLSSVNPSGRVYTVTNNGNQVYAAWNKSKIDLNKNFDFSFITNQGNNSLKNTGDGMMFVIQNSGPGISLGESALGYYNSNSYFKQSIGIEEDIFNSGKTYDDSSSSHLNLVKDDSPTPVLPQVNISPNLSDSANRKIRITWNRDANLLEVYFDGVKRYSWHYDIVKNVFKGNPNVWFGFTGSTGSAEIATQTFETDTLIYNQAIVNSSGDTICSGDSETLTASQGVSYLWSTGAKTRSIKTAKSGVYSVTIIDSSNCESTATDTVKIVILQQVSAAFTVSNICLSNSISLNNNTSPTTGLRYIWHFGDGNSASDKTPLYFYSSPGTYHITLSATNGGCTSTATKPVTIYAHPAGVVVSKGNPFQGQFNQGDKTSHDYGCQGDTVTYYFSSPKGYSDSDYGSKWIITSRTFATSFGTINTDTSFKSPTSLKDACFKFFPGAKFTDSILILTLRIRLIPSNCDTFITRYIEVRPHAASNFAFKNACKGLPVSFYDSSTITAGDSIRYWNWDFGDGAKSTLQNPNHGYPNPGIYKVTLTSLSKEGCGLHKTKNVTQYPNPVAAFHTGTVFCQNSSSFFTDSSFISSGTITLYAWNFGDSSGSMQTNPTHTYTKSGPYQAKLVVKSSSGCYDSISKAIRVKPAPIALFSYKNACAGELIYFSNKSTDSTPGTKYLWKFGDGRISTNTSPNNSYAINGSYNVELSATTKYGCSDTFTQKITPFAKPVPDIVYSNTCIHRAVAFGDSENNRTGNTYSWNFGDNVYDVASTNRDSHIYNKTGTYKISLTVQNARGCVDSSSEIIQISTYPVASFITTNFCAGKPIFFNNTSNGIGLSYSWIFGDQASRQYNYSNLKNPVHVYDTAGLYPVLLSVTNYSGCSDTITKNVQVMVSPLALHWNYAINNQTATFIPQDTTQKTYKWYFGTGDSSLLKKPVYTYKSNGKYLIELIETNADGCYSSNFDSISLGVLGMQSVPGSATDLHLSIFPNPFENKTKITYTLLRKSKVNVSVYDIEGKLVAQIKDGYYGEGKYQDEFDATQYNAVAGIYLLKIIVNGEVYTSRFAEMK